MGRVAADLDVLEGRVVQVDPDAAVLVDLEEVRDGRAAVAAVVVGGAAAALAP